MEMVGQRSSDESREHGIQQRGTNDGWSVSWGVEGDEEVGHRRLRPERVWT